MTASASELERVVERLEPEAAKRLELRVREAMADECPQAEPLPTLEELRRRRPDIADLIGAWADEDPEEPAELPLPPAKTW